MKKIWPSGLIFAYICSIIATIINQRLLSYGKELIEMLMHKYHRHHHTMDAQEMLAALNFVTL